MTIKRSTHYFRDRKTNKEFTVEIEIDMDILSRTLAVRALKSVHGKAQTAGGTIKAVIRHEEP